MKFLRKIKENIKKYSFIGTNFIYLNTIKSMNTEVENSITSYDFKNVENIEELYFFKDKELYDSKDKKLYDSVNKEEYIYYINKYMKNQNSHDSKNNKYNTYNLNFKFSESTYDNIYVYDSETGEKKEYYITSYDTEDGKIENVITEKEKYLFSYDLKTNEIKGNFDVKTCKTEKKPIFIFSYEDLKVDRFDSKKCKIVNNYEVFYDTKTNKIKENSVYLVNTETNEIIENPILKYNSNHNIVVFYKPGKIVEEDTLFYDPKTRENLKNDKFSYYHKTIEYLKYNEIEHLTRNRNDNFVYDNTYISNDFQNIHYSNQLKYNNHLILENLDLNNFNKINYQALNKLEINNYNFDSKVYIDEKVFEKFCNLKELKFSNIKGDVFIFFNKMKSFLKNLENLNINSCYTNITYFGDIFYYQESLKSLTIKNVEFTKKITDLYNFLIYFEKLQTLNISNIKGLDVIKLFKENKEYILNLTNLDISNNSTKETNLSSLFENCNKLVKVDMSNFKIISNTNLSNMFKNCKSLITIDLSNANFEEINNMNNMFENCENLKNLDISNTNIENINEFENSNIFIGCNNLTNLHMNNIKGEAVNLFFYNKNYLNFLKFLDFNNNSTKLDNIAETFSNMKSIEKINLKDFKINTTMEKNKNKNGTYSYFKKANINYLFNNCKKLEYLDLRGLDILGINQIEGLFENCTKLKKENIIIDKNSQLNKYIEKKYRQKNKESKKFKENKKNNI